MTNRYPKRPKRPLAPDTRADARAAEEQHGRGMHDSYPAPDCPICNDRRNRR